MGAHRFASGEKRKGDIMINDRDTASTAYKDSWKGKNGSYRAIDPKVAREEQIIRSSIHADKLENAIFKALITLRKSDDYLVRRPTIAKAIKLLEEALVKYQRSIQ